VRAARADVLQWFALFGGALAWTVQFVLGYGVAAATCSTGGGRWGIDFHAWQLSLALAAATVVLLAEIAAVVVLQQTRGVPEDGPPPDGRRHFFAVAASVGNVLFLVIVVLTAVGTLTHSPCHGS
jgi:hypothetical protein